MKKRLFALALTGAMTAGLLAGCGDASGGKVYYLNFKPEQDAQWQELAALYTEETGVEVTVLTAASGNYETTLEVRDGQDRRSHPLPGQRPCWPGCLEGLLL